MPVNLLIFDAEYVSELTARMNMACELLSEAVSSLRGASNHENWKCKERERIIEGFDELNRRLKRLDEGVNEATQVLSRSVSRFSALESQYESQANNLSDELTMNHGFGATVRTGAQSVRNVKATSNTGTVSVIRMQSGSIKLDGNTRTVTGAGTMRVNLPVTHIPDNPGAAAKGTKDTREIANAAFNSVVATMTEALSEGNSSDISRLVNTYNAGRSIYESSAAILESPTQPHTSERLAMAAGLVALAQDSGGHVVSGMSGDFTQNAGVISSALQGNSDATELRSLLTAIADTGMSEGNTSSSGSFFDRIIAELKRAFFGESSSTGESLELSSAVVKFFESFMTDQAV